MVDFQNVIKTKTGYKIFCTHFRAARVLNKSLKQYKQDNGKLYVFKEGEEAIFNIAPEMLKKTLKTLKTYNCLV